MLQTDSFSAVLVSRKGKVQLVEEDRVRGCSGADQKGRTCLLAVEGAGARDAAVSIVLDGDDKLVAHVNSGRVGVRSCVSRAISV